MSVLGRRFPSRAGWRVSSKGAVRPLLAVLTALALGGCKLLDLSSTAETPTGPTPAPTLPAATPSATALPEPIIIRINPGRPPATLDPAFVAPLDVTANDLVENLFIGLTRLNGDSRRTEPAFAKNWETSNDGLVWTVYLRDDIFWTRIDLSSGQMEKVRPVVAGDVVFALRRACRVDTQAPFATALFAIRGCEDLYRRDPTTLTPELVEQTLGARVLNDVVVEFTLSEANAAFPTVMAMPVMYPVPADLIEAESVQWTRPDKIWTSGTYAVQPTIPANEGYTLIANRFWPLDRIGNVDAVQISLGASTGETFAAWQRGDLALAAIPPEQLASLPLGDDPAYRLLAQPTTVSLVASYDTPPLDNADLRRALALALDRQSLIDQVLEVGNNSGIAAYTLIPPGSATGPRYAEVGLSYDPAAAQAALSQAGYAGCVGLPPITLLIDDTLALSPQLASTMLQMWEDTLGCKGIFSVEQRPLQDVYAWLHDPPASGRPPRPGLILLGWQADYPDAQHWLADVVGCREMFLNAYLDQSRDCIDADGWIRSASLLMDDDARAELNASISDAFFGPQGEMPLIPLFHHARPIAIQSWLEVYPLHAGPLRLDAWIVHTDQMP